MLNLKKLTLTILTAMLFSGCSMMEGFNQDYQSAYDGYLVTTSDCAAQSQITIEHAGVTVTAPGANACGNVDTPRHPGDVYAPYFTSTVNAVTAVGTTYWRINSDEKLARDANRTRIAISDNEVKSDEILFGAFTNTTQALVDSNADLLDRLLPEEEMEVTDPGDEVTDPNEPGDGGGDIVVDPVDPESVP